MNAYQFQDTVQWLNDKFEESNPREWWSECTRLNFPYIKKENSVLKYRDIYAGENEKAIVIVGASPALKRDIEHLKGLSDKYVIMVSNSAAKILIDNGIIPHYVISIDGDDVIAKRDLNFDSSGMTLITTNASSNKVVRQWKGKILWASCYAIEDSLKKQVRRLLGRRIPMGGNTSSFATSLSFEVFGARIFIFVGNEYCYDTQYYCHKRSKWEDKNVTHFKTKDVLGRDRLTNIPLFQYKMWLEKMIDQLTFCTFIDTSYGMLGTDSKYLRLLSLPDAIKDVDKSFSMKELAKTDWRIREKLRYDLAYASQTYSPNVGIKAWRSLLRQRDFSSIKRVLDVGCGFGQGVAMCRNKGIEAYGVDIAEGLLPYWQMANITQFCTNSSADKIPYPDNHFDLITCFDVLEHIPEEGIDDVLKEMYRIGTSDYLMSICLTLSFSKMFDGSEPHLLVKPLDWWMDKLEEIGFHCKQMNLSVSQTHLLLSATKNGNNPLLRSKDANSKVSRNALHTQRKQVLQLGSDFTSVQGSH